MYKKIIISIFIIFPIICFAGNWKVGPMFIDKVVKKSGLAQTKFKVTNDSNKILYFDLPAAQILNKGLSSEKKIRIPIKDKSKLIVSPRKFRLLPGVTQRVRVMRVSKKPITKDQMYMVSVGPISLAQYDKDADKIKISGGMSGKAGVQVLIRPSIDKIRYNLDIKRTNGKLTVINNSNTLLKVANDHCVMKKNKTPTGCNYFKRVSVYTGNTKTVNLTNSSDNVFVKIIGPEHKILTTKIKISNGQTYKYRG